MSVLQVVMGTGWHYVQIIYTETNVSVVLRVLCWCLKCDVSFQRKSQWIAGVVTTHFIQVNAVIRGEHSERDLDAHGIENRPPKLGFIWYCQTQMHIPVIIHICAHTIVQILSFSEQESALFHGQLEPPMVHAIQTSVWVTLSFSSRSIQVSSNVKSCCI